MTFISLSFMVFLAASFAVFFACPKKLRWVALLVISVAFYAINGVKYLPFILFTTISVFLCARGIGSNWDKQKLELADKALEKEQKKAIREQYKKKSKRLLILALVLNIGFLCVMKFTKFFALPISNLLLTISSGKLSFSASDIIVPLGVSYYTFSVIGYILDVYWKRYGAEKNYFRFLLYAIYFPHILQGPIERYNRLGERLKGELKFDLQRAIYGFELMLWGFFKKVVIADGLNIIIKDAFSRYNDNLGVYYLVALVFDVFYIYSDFSGCMDIARGVSQIFGIELDKNFERPFLSRSVTEFWRRWHMTLGGWFRDYVYMPVTTSRPMKSIGKTLKSKNAPAFVTKAIVVSIPVYITWVLTGLWHGTGKGYVAWGVYYATLITLSTLFSEPIENLMHKIGVDTDTTGYRILRTVKIFFIFLFGRFLSATGSLGRALVMLKSFLTNPNWYILTDGSMDNLLPISRQKMTVLIIAILILVAVDLMQEHCEITLRERLSKENVALRVVLTVGLALAIAIFGVYGKEYSAASFVYMAY